MGRGVNPEPNDLSRAVSRVVRLLMEADGLSARALAAESGLTKDTGRLLFNGTTSWTVPELDQVCEVLDVKASEVVAAGETLRDSGDVSALTQDAVARAAHDHVHRERGSTIREH